MSYNRGSRQNSVEASADVPSNSRRPLVKPSLSVEETRPARAQLSAHAFLAFPIQNQTFSRHPTLAGGAVNMIVRAQDFIFCLR